MLHFPEQKTKAVKQRRPGGACGPCRASVWEKSASPPPVASTLPELSLPPNARPQMRLPRSKIPHHGPLLQLPRENVQRTPLCFTEKSPLMMAVVPRKEGRRQGTVGGGERALPPPRTLCLHRPRPLYSHSVHHQVFLTLDCLVALTPSRGPWVLQPMTTRSSSPAGQGQLQWMWPAWLSRLVGTGTLLTGALPPPSSSSLPASVSISVPHSLSLPAV